MFGVIPQNRLRELPAAAPEFGSGVAVAVGRLTRLGGVIHVIAVAVSFGESVAESLQRFAGRHA